MKKSLYAVIVVLLSLVGANALAAIMDFNVERVTVESIDGTGNTNGVGSGGGGVVNAVVREK